MAEDGYRQFESVKLPTIAVPETYPGSKPHAYNPKTLRLQDVTQFEEEDQSIASARISCTARWKPRSSVDEDFTYGDMISNANVVQWSDGSYSLVIGGTEIFDLNMHPVGKNEHLHLFAQHQSELLMEDVGEISEKIFLRPVGVSSMANKLSRTHSESKVKMAFMPQDPEAQRLEMEKKIRQKQEAERRKYEERQLKKGISRTSHHLTKEWLEGAPAKSRQQASVNEDEYEDDEEDEEYEEDENETYGEEDEEEDGEYEEEDAENSESDMEDEDEGELEGNDRERPHSKPTRPKVKRATVLSDGDE